MFEQNDLKGLSKKRISLTNASMGAYQKMYAGEDFDVEIMNEMYREMSRDIQVQRRRMGGDWAVCQAVPTRAQRDVIRSILGPELVFVVLEMSKEMVHERLNKRETFGEEMTKKMKKMRDAFESAMEDEENAIALKLTRDMTPIHVVEKILSNDLVNK
jgi:gluconate kinase